MPDAELLVRWTQACALNPRLIMNSWKADGTVNTPWLHAEATPAIRAAIELRLRLLPYLYTQRWLASVEHAPVLRPTFYDFPGDAACRANNDEMMVGPDLLVAPVFDAGARERTLHLPRDASTPGWFELDTGRWHESGRTITVDAPLDRLPLFVRAGATIPTTDASDASKLTDEPSRALHGFPAPAGVASAPRTSAWVEDDGISEAWRDGIYLRATSTLASDAHGVTLAVRRTGGSYALPAASVRVTLPPGDARPLAVRATGIDRPLVRG